MNRDDKVKLPKNPVITMSFIGEFFYWFTKDIFRLGLKRPLEETDVYEVLDEFKCEQITNNFKNLWSEELTRPEPSLLRLILRTYGYKLIAAGFAFVSSEVVTTIGQPLCLGGLVAYFYPGQTDITRDEAYFYAGFIVFCSAFTTCLIHPYTFYTRKLCLKLRIGCCALLYNKTLKFSKSTSFDGMNGQLINLMTNDVILFDELFLTFNDLWKGPAISLLVGYFVYREIGVSALIGIGYLLAFIPLQAWFGKKSATFRLRTAKRSDTRVRFMNEIIHGIQVIKMYAWEKSFGKIADDIRKKEIRAIRGTMLIRAILFSFMTVSRISIFLSLVSYVLLGNVITARKVFVVSGFFSILNGAMVQYWPMGITALASGLVSLKRMKTFLLASEVKETKVRPENRRNEIDILNLNNDRFEKKQVLKFKKTKAETVGLLRTRRIENISTDNPGVIFDNVTAVWDVHHKQLGISSINLQVTPGVFCAVIGPVGSGKSTLLSTIIGDLELDDGSLTINGRISYAPQEPWLFDGSIRQNIQFIEEWDEARYWEVCRICALERDFELLPHGDSTIVGERGVILSGGQKARISLARAVYKDCEIYLLDDPLSAVDTHVGKHIFNECIVNYLRDKCVILVTHQLQYLKDVPQIVLLENGSITASGNYDHIVTLNADSILSLTVHEEAEEENFTKMDTKVQSAKSMQPQEEEFGELEGMSEGSVKFEVYKNYMKSVDNIFTVVFVLLLFTIVQVATTGLDFFVASWVNWEEAISLRNSTTISSPIDTSQNGTDTDLSVIETRNLYLIIYTVLAVFFAYITAHLSFAFFVQFCLQASTNLHDKLFRGISRAKMSFFNNNSSGRILNRFSKDIGNVDVVLPNIIMDTLTFYFEMVAISLIIAIINPWFLVPTILAAFSFYMLQFIYLKTSRSINRLEALSRSPLFAHINATIQGLSTIRAFRAQNVVVKVFNRNMDKNSATFYIMLATTRAFAFSLDFVCILYVGVVTTSFLFIGENNLSGNVGLAVSQVIGLVGIVQWGIRQAAEMENKMVSVERIEEYSELPSEPPLETLPKNQPPKEWPEFGAISFSNVTMRYSANGTEVLRQLTFRIERSEKIGIVGRTGAGKSSIIQALFRLREFDGRIDIDGVDTKSLGLHDLRRKIAIIPQDPILFSGSMRNNLDPFLVNSDYEIWKALEEVELKAAVKSLAGGLNCRISEGGANFSMGQRQLICLARAILLNTTILVLDEATANVDPETDKLIQKTIRLKFSECTVLTIAHRLHTVMDSDRVLVMDSGYAAEFGQPYELLQRPGGNFKQLVDNTGPATSLALSKFAENIYKIKQESEKIESQD